MFARWLGALTPLIRRSRLICGAGLVLVLLGIGTVIALPHLEAWYHFREARHSLGSGDLAAARRHLACVLEIWPDSVEAHFLAARTARRLEDFDAADEHLKECDRLQENPSDEYVLEWGMFRAQNGALAGVEEALRTRVEKKDPHAALILEALTKGYLRMYRLVDAQACLRLWLQLEPDNSLAWFLRGQARQRVHDYANAAKDYRRVLKLDRANHEARLRLATCLLETGQTESAVRQLHYLRRRQPENAEVLVRLAFAENSRGQVREARRHLDALLAAHPDYGPGLTGRAQLALDAGRLEEAEHWLRRAVKVDPADRQANFLLFRCLKLQGNKKAAERQRLKLRQIENRLERVIRISNGLMPLRPHDPALHCELGTLFLAMGHEEIGVRWLESALQLRPNYGPAHAALADYYRHHRDPRRAAEHRKLAQGVPTPEQAGPDRPPPR